MTSRQYDQWMTEDDIPQGPQGLVSHCEIVSGLDEESCVRLSST